MQPLLEDRRNVSLEGIRYSPDGTKLAVVTLVGADYDIWIYDLERSRRGRLARTHISFTRPGTDEFEPIWSPDGSRVAFSSRDGETYTIYRARADGSGRSRALVSMETSLFPTSWSPDGRTIAYSTILKTGDGPDDWGRDIWTVPADGGAPELFLKNAMDGAFSPNGLWLAYARREDGRIHVTTYPGRENTVEVAIDEEVETAEEIAGFPRWSSNGRELYYVGSRGMWRVPILSDPQDEPEFRAGTPQRVPVGNRFHAYDVSPDGQGFVLIERTYEVPTDPEIVVVPNWFEELKRLVPAGR